MTSSEWKKLRSGDRVWVWAQWCNCCPMLGIVKHDGDGRKSVWINFFGELQGWFWPGSYRRLREMLEVYHENN